MATNHAKRSLMRKLGLKEGLTITILNPPPNYHNTLGRLPKNITEMKTLRGSLDFIHLFTKKKEELATEFPRLKRTISQNGVIWISWPKASSDVETDLDEDTVRKTGLSNGLVDVKICAIDEDWSGLKFVYRLKDRR